MSDVTQTTITLPELRLENGTVMRDVAIACQVAGTLDATGRNAVLLAHGYSAHHRMMGTGGSWAAMAGPGRAIDTDRFFVVSTNMLGSSYGSTGPASINPGTGKPWGPDFPDISLIDQVNAQRLALDQLGVKHLTAIAGVSFGGQLAFQWAVTHPDFVSGIIPTASAPKGRGDHTLVDTLVARLARDPNWNGGWFYENGGLTETLTTMRIDNLRSYGMDAVLAAKVADPAKRESMLQRMAEQWAREFDANSLVVLRRAAVRFNARKDLQRMKARVLYSLSTTDTLFPPSIAPDVMAALKTAGVEAEYFELVSEQGHMAPLTDCGTLAPQVRAFLDRLAP